jgi:hypothetical protein
VAVAPLEHGPTAVEGARDVGAEVEGQAAVVSTAVETVLDDQPAFRSVQPDPPAVDDRWPQAPVAVVGGRPLGHRAAVQPGYALELGPGLPGPEVGAGRHGLVDTADFLIAYCPTNIYSVGTAHEIILSRQQMKPVLFVSPPVTFPIFDELRDHLRNDPKGAALLERLADEVPIKPNPRAIPSLWYMPLIGSGNFFDGFGFKDYVERFNWKPIPMDEREAKHPPQHPLLPFLEKLSQQVPKRWDNKLKKYVTNDDWLLWELDSAAPQGEIVTESET